MYANTGKVLGLGSFPTLKLFSKAPDKITYSSEVLAEGWREGTPEELHCKLPRCSSRHNGLYRWVLQCTQASRIKTAGYYQTNWKIDTGKNLKLWPFFVDHYKHLCE